MSAYTLKLDTDSWDLTLDAAGNISTATDDYAIAQNVANAVRLFTNDSYFWPGKGIPHYLTSLGADINPVVVQSRVEDAALAIDGVSEAEAILDDIDSTRVLSGSVYITTEDGETADVAL